MSISGLMRSEDMKHGTLVLPVDQARTFVNLIGFHANIEFEDMNTKDLHRPYRKHVQRLDEMERILRFLREEILKLPGWHEDDIKVGNTSVFLDHAEDYSLDEVETHLKRLSTEVVEFRTNLASLLKTRNRILEECFVADVAASFQPRRPQAQAQEMKQPTYRGLSNIVGHRDDDSDEDAVESLSLLDCNSREAVAAAASAWSRALTTKAGVVLQSEQDRFARALFRATRGNTYTYFHRINEPLIDPQTSAEVKKSVFVVFFQNMQSFQVAGAATGVSGESALAQKIDQVCRSFGLDTYPWYETERAATAAKAHLLQQSRDQQKLLEHLQRHLQSEAINLIQPTCHGGNSLIEDWRLFCVKEKAIYATLNMFEGRMNLRASCWYPAREEHSIKQLLVEACGGSGAKAMLVADKAFSRTAAPTYIRTNELTEIAQQLVDTYGIPRYKEANPALLTVVTFPFLFGVMFGDVGHGALLLILGLCVMWNAESFQKTAPAIYAFRYMLTMMGFFATYAGLLYNDFFSVGLFVFESRWNFHSSSASAASELQPQTWFDPTNSEGGYGPYPFGVDPAWRVAVNELVFINSMKMKISVILGLAHMLAGLILRWANAWYERDGLGFIGECIPMMIFMLCFVGFMDFMILYKWVTPLEDPPSIINSLIATALGAEDEAAMFGEALPRCLMLMAVLTIPWMLLYKPFLLWRRSHRRKQKTREGHRYRSPCQVVGDSDIKEFQFLSLGAANFWDEEKQDPHIAAGEEELEDFDIGDVMIHQAIETIEFVLGTVSHTASYLRLWALSLAHQQLSAVFFGLVLGAMQVSFPLNAIAVYVAFAVWLAITVGILLGMDAMECFLHTLRLHWVEFQSKFYKADGHKFKPYRHKALLEEA